ncbi:MAG: hypothetical protein QM528_00235 [Phycisphaerales bacterium]|nr:hypothetical protein [Phycisphaerales bacterium]
MIQAEFSKIYLIWRRVAGQRRTAIGTIQKDDMGKHTFSYSSEEILQTVEGFKPYTEFQDVTKVYNGNVVDIFAQRLTKSSRPDIDNFYNFWEVDKSKANDKFYLLGKTQGMLLTDNFEFLADYNYIDGLHFVTEIVGLNKIKHCRNTLQIRDILTYQLESTNQDDKFAVKVYKDDEQIGWIKKYHGRIFHEATPNALKLEVKAIELGSKAIEIGGQVIEKHLVPKRVFIRVTTNYSHPNQITE